MKIVIGDGLMNFGDKLKEFRKRRGLRQLDIAEELGVKQNTYSDYENNKAQPSIESLIKLVKILEVPIDSLLEFNFESDHTRITNVFRTYLVKRDLVLSKLNEKKIDLQSNIEIVNIINQMESDYVKLRDDLDLLKKLLKDKGL